MYISQKCSFFEKFTFFKKFTFFEKFTFKNLHFSKMYILKIFLTMFLWFYKRIIKFFDRIVEVYKERIRQDVMNHRWLEWLVAAQEM